MRRIKRVKITDVDTELSRLETAGKNLCNSCRNYIKNTERGKRRQCGNF